MSNWFGFGELVGVVGVSVCIVHLNVCTPVSFAVTLCAIRIHHLVSATLAVSIAIAISTACTAAVVVTGAAAAAGAGAIMITIAIIVHPRFIPVQYILH